MSNDWFITIVNGFSRAGDKNFNNFIVIPSCPEEFFVCRDERTFAAWFSSMSVKWNDVKMLLLRYLRYVSFMGCATFFIRFGPTLMKKSLNWLTIYIGSFIFFPFDMIDFNPCRFCLVLHNISFIVFHVFLTFDLLLSNSCLKYDIFASRIVFLTSYLVYS